MTICLIHQLCAPTGTQHGFHTNKEDGWGIKEAPPADAGVTHELQQSPEHITNANHSESIRGGKMAGDEWSANEKAAER